MRNAVATMPRSTCSRVYIQHVGLHCVLMLWRLGFVTNNHPILHRWHALGSLTSLRISDGVTRQGLLDLRLCPSILLLDLSLY